MSGYGCVWQIRGDRVLWTRYEDVIELMLDVLRDGLSGILWELPGEGEDDLANIACVVDDLCGGDTHIVIDWNTKAMFWWFSVMPASPRTTHLQLAKSWEGWRVYWMAQGVRTIETHYTNLTSQGILVRDNHWNKRFVAPHWDPTLRKSPSSGTVDRRFAYPVTVIYDGIVTTSIQDYRNVEMFSGPLGVEDLRVAELSRAVEGIAAYSSVADVHSGHIQLPEALAELREHPLGWPVGGLIVDCDKHLVRAWYSGSWDEDIEEVCAQWSGWRFESLGDRYEIHEAISGIRGLWSPVAFSSFNREFSRDAVRAMKYARDTVVGSQKTLRKAYFIPAPAPYLTSDGVCIDPVPEF